MKAPGFEFETAPRPADPPSSRREADPRPVVRAAPQTPEDESQRGEEPPEEPGYGHGV